MSSPHPQSVTSAVTSAAIAEAGNLRLALTVLREPFAWWIMVAAFTGAVLLLGLLGAGLWWASGFLPNLSRTAWGAWLYGGLGTALFLCLAWFLFPVTMTAVAGLFLEPLADRIERRHYPELPKAREIPLAEQFKVSVRALVRGFAWNLAALPLYLIPGLNLLAYAYVNARLLSREYFQVVSLRHVTAPQSREIYARHHWSMIRGGLVIAGVFVLPVVQFFAPVLATAWMVHRLWREPGAPLRAPAPAPS